jgi:hypothetical protein
MIAFSGMRFAWGNILLGGIFCMEMQIKGVESSLSLLLLIYFLLVCLLEDIT